MQLLVLALLLVLARTPPAQADIDSAVRAIQTRHFDTALNQLLPLAQAGDVTAQYEVGVLYTNGDGVPTNLAQAAKWFRLAESRGHVQAKDAIAFLEAAGVPVPKIEPPPPPLSSITPTPATPGSTDAAPAVTTAPFVLTPGSPYAMIQIATVKTEKIAEAEWRRMKRLHPDQLGNTTSSTEPFESGDKGTVYRLLAGPFAVETARVLCSKIREKGSTCLVLRRL